MQPVLCVTACGNDEDMSENTETEEVRC